MENDLIYKIADFYVKLNCRSKYLEELCSPYLTIEEAEAEINLCYSKEECEKYKNQGMTFATFEYNFTMGTFVRNIVERDAFCYHASSLSVDGEGILFSADSGTGKSTHSRLWQEFMKEHEIVNLNDDKPIIRIIDGKPWVYGSPWSGKHGINNNACAPVKALVFLEQGAENQIREMRPEEVFPLVFPQVLGGKANQQQVAQLMDLLDRFIRGIRVYKLQCNISEEAVRLVYDTVWKE